MRINTLFYCMWQGFKNIFRNKWFTLASVATISACLFLFGLFYSLLTNFQYMVKTTEEKVSVKTEKKNVNNELFGESGLLESVKKHINHTVNNQAHNIINDVLKFSVNTDLTDDLTIIDSPGFVLKKTLYSQTDFELIRRINPNKTIKPVTYQLKANTSIILEDKIRIYDNIIDYFHQMNNTYLSPATSKAWQYQFPSTN